MLQITPQMKILVAVDPVDFRKGIDGLVQVCKASLKQDPFTGNCICVSQPSWYSDQGAGIRWARVLALPEASLGRTVPLVAALCG